MGSNVRGSWLEAAVMASCEMYRMWGTGCIQKIATPYVLPRGKEGMIRQRSTIDFMGVFRGTPVAFDCKASQSPSLPFRNVKDHQVRFLENFAQAGGEGALLVCFEERGTFWVPIKYWQLYRTSTNRKSLSYKTCTEGEALGGGVCQIQHGEDGVPINFGPAIEKGRGK